MLSFIYRKRIPLLSDRFLHHRVKCNVLCFVNTQPEIKCNNADDRWPNHHAVYCNFYNHVSSRGTCQQCNGKPVSRGLGDTVAKVTNAMGLEKCGGCAERQQKLNQLVQFNQTKEKKP